jgi:hypothetical protein
LGIQIPDPDPGARKLRNFSGKMQILILKKIEKEIVFISSCFSLDPDPD